MIRTGIGCERSRNSPAFFRPARSHLTNQRVTGRYAAVSVLSAVVTGPGRNPPYHALIITARMNVTKGACS